MSNTHNNFNIYIGIAVEDRQLNSTSIKVYIKELVPMAVQNVADGTANETFNIYDESSNSKVNDTVKVSNSFDAEYFGITSNRSFPPDVVKGEQVLVFRYADTDRYFWLSLGRNDNLRKGEILRLAISDDMNSVKELSDDNTYLFEMNTRTKKSVTLKTCKSNGELFAYCIQIDAINNFLSISDDADNRIIIESGMPRVKMSNSSGTIVDLLKDDLWLVAPNRIILKCNNLIMNYGSSSSYGVGDSRSYRVGNSYDFTIGDKFNDQIGNNHNSVAGNSTNTVNGTKVTQVNSGQYQVKLGDPELSETVSIVLTEENVATYIGCSVIPPGSTTPTTLTRDLASQLINQTLSLVNSSGEFNITGSGLSYSNPTLNWTTS